MNFEISSDRRNSEVQPKEIILSNVQKRKSVDILKKQALYDR